MTSSSPKKGTQKRKGPEKKKAASAKVAAKRDWVVTSLNDVALFFGVARDTVRRDWRARGMPGKLRVWALNEIAQWRIQRAEDRAITALEADGDPESTAEAERRKTWAEALAAEVKLEQLRGELLWVEEVARETNQANTHARALLEQLPDRLLASIPPGATGDDQRRFLADARKAIEGVVEAMHDYYLARITEEQCGDE